MSFQSHLLRDCKTILESSAIGLGEARTSRGRRPGRPRASSRQQSPAASPQGLLCGLQTTHAQHVPPHALGLHWQRQPAAKCLFDVSGAEWVDGVKEHTITKVSVKTSPRFRKMCQEKKHGPYASDISPRSVRTRKLKTFMVRPEQTQSTPPRRSGSGLSKPSPHYDLFTACSQKIGQNA